MDGHTVKVATIISLQHDTSSMDTNQITLTLKIKIKTEI